MEVKWVCNFILFLQCSINVLNGQHGWDLDEKKSQGHHRQFYCVCASRERVILVHFIWAGHACICLVRCLLEAILQGDVLLSHSWCRWSRAFTVHRHSFKCHYLWLLILYHFLCCSSHRRYKDSLWALNDLFITFLQDFKQSPS